MTIVHAGLDYSSGTLMARSSTSRQRRLSRTMRSPQRRSSMNTAAERYLSVVPSG